LLYHLETVHIASDWSMTGLRFPVQWVNRPNNPTDHALHDFRGLSGQIASGLVRVGDGVVVLPSGLRSTVKQIWTYDGPLAEAFCPQSVTLVLEHDLDISRGDMIVGLNHFPGVGSEFQARVCWMNQKPLVPGKKYLLKHTTQTVQAIVSGINGRVDVSSYDVQPANELALNDIGDIRLRTAKPLVVDGYRKNRLTGSFILIEQGTNLTLGAGMLEAPSTTFRFEDEEFAI
jgi:bifunctional enzyme CysN/CysC/sulfate adenylyltransferase subunit 1